jgi:PAS domain S-box-containing protein
MDHQNIFPALRDELALLRQRVVELEAVEASRQQTEEALRTSEKRYRALVETTGTGYCILDAEGRVRSANAEYVRLTGHHTLEEIAGRGVVEWTAEYDRERNAAEVAKCFERGSVRNLEIDYVDRAGQITPVELNATVLGAGPRALILTLCRDITERKRAEEERDRLVRFSIDMLCTAGFDGRLKHLNPAWEKVLGWSAQELTSSSWLDFVHPDDRERTVAAGTQLLRGQTVLGFQNRYRCRDGTYRWLSWNSFPMPAERLIIGVVRDITERKQAEAELFESQQMLRLILDTIPQRVFWKDRNSIYLGCNRSFAGDSRHADPSELIGKSDFEMSWREVAELYRADDRQVMDSGTPKIRYEEPQLREDGTRSWLNTSKLPLLDQRGQVIGVLGTYEDITERKQSEEALRESEEKFSKAFQDAPVLMAISDIESGRYLDINGKCLTLTGYAREEIIGHTSEEVGWTTIEERGRRNELLERGGRIVDREVTMRQKNGELLHCLYSGHVITLQGRKRLLSISQDITARRRVEERVAQLGYLRQQLLGASPLDGKLKLITDGVVTILGADFSRIWMVRKADLCDQGCPHAAVSVGPDVCRDRTRCLHLMASSGRYTGINGGHRRVPLGCYKIGRVATGEDTGFVTNDVGHDPRVHDHAWAQSLGLVAFAGRRLVDGDGKPTGVLALFSTKPILPGEEDLLEDIAATASQVILAAHAEQQRHELEAQMQQAQKLESLGVLAGGIAHDFNNLLTAILGHANLALMDLAPEAPARDSLREIEKASARAAELCRQMLAYAGRGRFVVESINLSRLIEELAHLLRVSISKKILLRCQLAEEIPAIEADPAQLRQVAMNLVINAAEAIGDTEGVIGVSTGVAQCGEDDLRGGQLVASPAPGSYVYLEVTDTGCGMDAETRARIFDPFFTTKFAGRGLGLAAVLGIVRSHRGTLKVESERGRGTTFRILFPASAQAAAPVEAGGNAPPWRGTGTILVVDDEEPVRNVASRMLERCGFTVLRACDGQEALDLFHIHASEIVCVLLDLAMPRMDGEETLRELRRIQPGVRIVLASGYSDQEIAQRFRGAGLAGFIEKPYRMEALSAKLREALARAPIGT